MAAGCAGAPDDTRDQLACTAGLEGEDQRLVYREELFKDGTVEEPTGVRHGGATFYLDEAPPAPSASDEPRDGPTDPVRDDRPRPDHDHVRIEAERDLTSLELAVSGELGPGEDAAERSVDLEGAMFAVGGGA